MKGCTRHSCVLPTQICSPPSAVPPTPSPAHFPSSPSPPLLSGKLVYTSSHSTQAVHNFTYMYIIKHKSLMHKTSYSLGLARLPSIICDGKKTWGSEKHVRGRNSASHSVWSKAMPFRLLSPPSFSLVVKTPSLCSCVDVFESITCSIPMKNSRDMDCALARSPQWYVTF